MPDCLLSENGGQHPYPRLVASASSIPSSSDFQTELRNRLASRLTLDSISALLFYRKHVYSMIFL